jgi:predicted nucleic acid-binding protein
VPRLRSLVNAVEQALDDALEAMPVVDASVWVALSHSGDRHHRRCREWLSSSLADGSALAAPSLLLAEVAAALRRLTEDEALARESAEALVELELVELHPLTLERAVAAASVAAELGLRGADAVYVALADERREPLITLDRQQLERAGERVDAKRP